MNLFDAAREALMECDPDTKCAKASALRQSYHGGESASPIKHEAATPIAAPGRPDKPVLVSPNEVRQRGLGTLQGRAALIHALAHIEFNAINLALDAVYRFRDLPPDFYADWLRVADEEALHFKLLRDHLHTLDFAYGDFPAHNGLWDMAVKTAHDPLVRMALVPRLLEARGLDVTPGIRAKLEVAGDQVATNILDIILRDEIGHVAIGNRWFSYLCDQRSLTPSDTFAALLKEYATPRPRPPFNRCARKNAGFSDEELAWLENGT
jgi:uncharacterized ferritin-like protein (DUF455 family)